MSEAQEMSLDQYLFCLHKDHRARRELRDLRARLEKESALADRLAYELTQLQWTHDLDGFYCPGCGAELDGYGVGPGAEARHKPKCTIAAALIKYAERRKTK